MATVEQIKTQILAIDEAATFGSGMLKEDYENMLLSLQDPAVDKKGHTFLSEFDMAQAFSWNQLQDEQHSPGDLLENYPAPFQAEVEKLRAITEVKPMKAFGNWAFESMKPAISQKAWNFWCVEYKMKQRELVPSITEHGQTLLDDAQRKLDACTTYDQVKAFGGFWYKLQEANKLEDEFGMNITEIDALWKTYAQVKKRWEAMTNGATFAGSPSF